MFTFAKNSVLSFFTNSENSAERFREAHNEFQCLKWMARDLSQDFYNEYYSEVKMQIKERWISNGKVVVTMLDKHFNSFDTIEKYNFLEILSMCLTESKCVVAISVFSDFPPSEWRKELLIYYLLSNNEMWDVTRTPRLSREIDGLAKFMKENSTKYSIEDILEILIKNQNDCQLDVEFIIYVLILLRSDVRALDVIARDKCLLPLIVHELEILQLRGKCDRWGILYDDEKQIVKLQRLLLHSEELIDRCLEKIESNTHINKLIDFFATLEHVNLQPDRKVKVLFDLGIRERSVKEWKKRLFSEIILETINREFCDCHLSEFVDGDENHEQTYFSSIGAEGDKIYTNYNEHLDSGRTDLKRALHCSEKVCRLHSLLNHFHKHILLLALNCDWSMKILEIVERYIKSFDNEAKIVQLNNSLEILIDYKINIVESGVCDVISQSNAVNVQRNVHKFVIEKMFPGTFDKSLDQLIEELLDCNPTKNISLLREKDTLHKAYEAVMNAYGSKSSLFLDKKPIKDWDDARIKNWIVTTKQLTALTSIVKNQDTISQVLPQLLLTLHGQINATELAKMVPNVLNESGPFFDDINMRNERIALIKRAFELTWHMKLRDVQLLSVILMLNSETGRGRLAQINTGEGKTIVIAMIAAYHATRGHHVDVITSSPLLAIPQSREQAPFFAKLNLSVHHNINDNNGYTYDVLYGTSLQFQGDILRDEFHRRGTRKGRKFDIAIVDEVDNMLVDGNNHIVLLSSFMPAMDHLETLLAIIYAQVTAVAGSLVTRDGFTYLVMQDNAFDENGEVMKNVDVNEVPIKGSKREFIEKSTELHLRQLIGDCDKTKVDDNSMRIKIPKHLWNLVSRVHLKKWIKRAVFAKFDYIKDEDYILEDGKIKIVDVNDTGVVKANSRWSYGLHQFLEIKHGAKIHPESLTSNYISNVSFFRRYRPNIYGLSGTLGSNATKELLCKTYDVDTIVVPPFKSKQYIELSVIVTNRESDWYTQITKSCLRKLKNQRAVLIIMKYIREAEKLEKIFKERIGYKHASIKLYKTNADASIVEKSLVSGDVVITTNIVGRGTDIKVSKDIDNNGGLHVCVTFLPKNSRVELQNTGRTARTGNRGTSQFVLWNSRTNDVDELRKQRENKEEAALKRAEEEIKKVMAKDGIFQEFSEITRCIKGRNDETKKFDLMAAEERFAMWKEEHEDKINRNEDVLKEFQVFKEGILQDDANGTLIKNPYMHVQIGNNYLDKKEYSDAIDEYTSAITIDDHFAENAYYNRGYATIVRYGENIADNGYYIDRAINDFRSARKLIEERESCLHLLQSASDGQVFSDHVTHKLNLYGIQKNAIDLAIGPDIDAIEQEIERLKDVEKSDALKSNDQAKKDHEERMKSLKEAKKRVGVIEKARSKKRHVTIERLTLKECLPGDDFESHQGEIEEFERNGYMGGFQISEIPPIDWNAVIGLLVLGFGQLVIGAALTVFTLGGGASFGAGLIAEGLSDIITAVKEGIINRTFSWASWAIEKAISITVSIACAGFKAMKDVAQTAYAGAKSAASIGSKVVTQTVKSGWKLVAKKVGVELAKGVGREMATQLIDYGLDSSIIPTIQQQIIDYIEGPIQQALLNNPLVEKMLKLDERNKDHQYENRIIALGREILNPAKDSTFIHMSTEIANRIAINKSSWYSMANKVLSVESALYGLSTFTSSFIKKLNESISKEAKAKKIDELSLDANEENPTADKPLPQGTRSEMKSDGEKVTGDDIDLNRLDVADEQVRSSSKTPTPKGISETFVNIAATNMMGIIKGKLISPIVQASVNYGMDKITSSIDASMRDQVENFRAHKRIIHEQNKGFNKEPNNHADVGKAKELIESTEKADNATRKIDELIEDTHSGGPSGLLHLGAISDAIDKPIAVYDRKGRLKYVIGDYKKGEPVCVQYHESQNGDAIGHYTLTDAREPFNRGGGRNMCLYNVIAEQTNRDPKKLKRMSLDIMTNNKEQIAQQVQDITRLEMYSSMSLAMGGVEYSATNPDGAAAYLSASQGTRGYRYRNPGHPKEHVPFRSNTEELWKAIAEKTGKNVEVYDKDGNIIVKIDADSTDLKKSTESNNSTNSKETAESKKTTELKNSTQSKKPAKDSKDPKKSDTLKMVHHNVAGDQTSEYYTILGGTNDPYQYHHPHDNMKFYELIAKETGHEAVTLKDDVLTSMNSRRDINPCVENAARRTGRKTGFLSEPQMNFVTHYAMQTAKCKAALAKLNEYKEGSNVDKDYVRQEVHISAKELNLPKTMYGGEWDKNGKPVNSWPVRDITIVLQHRNGEQNDKNAKVHIQTIFPRVPPVNYQQIPKLPTQPPAKPPETSSKNSSNTAK